MTCGVLGEQNQQVEVDGGSCMFRMLADLPERGGGR